MKRRWKVWWSAKVGMWAIGRVRGRALGYKSTLPACFKFISRMEQQADTLSRLYSPQKIGELENHVFHQAVS